MTQQEIKQAVSGISKLLASNPEMLGQQLTMLKALVPDLDEATINGIIQKTKEPGFNPRQLDTELQKVVSAIKTATQD